MSKVKINGARFKLLLKLWNDKKLAATSRWKDSFWKFVSDQDDKTPETIDDAIGEAETAIATLQTLQAAYNIETKVQFDSITMPLLQAVKMIGGAGRCEKRWSEGARNETATTRRMRRYEMETHNEPRDSEKEYPVRTMAMNTIEAKSLEATKEAALLREAIAKGNGTIKEMEIPDGLLIDGQ